TIHMYSARFSRTEAKYTVFAGTGSKLNRCARTSCELRSLPRTHFHAMNHRTLRDTCQRQCISRANWRICTRNNTTAYLDLPGRNYIASLTVCIQNQRNIGAAVWIIFQTLNSPFDAVLVALEVYDAVMLTMPAAAMTNS